MQAELEGYLDQLTSIRQDAPGIVAGLTVEQFNWRPGPGKWSIAECFDHLNITAGKFIPAFDAAIDRARASGLSGPGPFVYPLLERWFVRSMEPPARTRMRARKAFKPSPQHDPGAVLAAFIEGRTAVAERIARADGLDPRRARFQSPVAPILRYSLGTGFAAFLAHDRRHLWQARAVRNHPAFPAAQAA